MTTLTASRFIKRFCAETRGRRRQAVCFCPESLEPRLSPSCVQSTYVLIQNVPSDPYPFPPPPAPPSEPPTGPVGPALS